MHTARKLEPQPAADGALTIHLSGPADEVKRLLAAIAAADAAQEPTQMFLSVPEVSRRTGISEDRLRGLVKAGRLTNYNTGTGARILLSLADVRQAAQE